MTKEFSKTEYILQKNQVTNKMANQKMLELRYQIRKKRPKFQKSDAHKKVRVSFKYKKPRGLQNKVRLNKRGYRIKVKKGFRSPKEVRNLDRSGLISVLVSRIQELSTLDKKTSGIIISGRVGDKNRLLIIEEANKLGLSILNLDAEKKSKEIKESLEKRRAKKKKAEEEQKAKKKAEEAEKKKSIDQKVKKEEKEQAETDEEKKKQEKKEKDKILTTKQ